MSGSDQAVVDFLADHVGSASRKMKIALTLAESMVGELKLTLSEWEATVRTLKALERTAASTVN
jgi:hypothetical protein